MAVSNSVSVVRSRNCRCCNVDCDFVPWCHVWPTAIQGDLYLFCSYYCYCSFFQSLRCSPFSLIFSLFNDID